MTRVALPPLRAPVLEIDDVQHLVIDDASWALYERLLRDICNRSIKVNYDDGRMEVMSPLPEHEEPKEIIGRLIQELSFELNVEIKSLGSTTFRRRDKAKGLEPDQCYYFKHERKFRGRKRLDLLKDPPPELVVEIDITSRSVPRLPIYAALGVPEIWRWDGARLECLELVADDYRPRPKSLAFPMLAPADLTRFIKMRGRAGENAIIRKFRQWVRDNGWTSGA